MGRSAATPPEDHGHSRTVLLVEDDELVRELFLDQLETAGFDVVSACSGEEALSRFRSRSPDLLLTDITLPGRLTGWDIAERCRRLHPDVPVVYVSAYSFVEGRPVPGSRYVRKPFLSAQILAAFAEVEAELPRSN